MNDAEINAVTALPGPQRYEYFIKRAADFEAVWSLKGPDGWVLAADDNGVEHIPVWPFAEFAAPCAVGDWQGTLPESIDLDDWMSKWLAGIQRDERLVAVFYTPKLKGRRSAARRAEGAPGPRIGAVCVTEIAGNRASAAIRLLRASSNGIGKPTKWDGGRRRISC